MKLPLLLFLFINPLSYATNEAQVQTGVVIRRTESKNSIFSAIGLII